MAVVTVTGGAGQSAIRLTFDAGANTIAARSLGYLISQEFSGATATDVSATQNTGGSTSSGTPGGYLVITEGGTTDMPFGMKAIVTTGGPTTVFGGSADGQQVLSQGNLSYTTFNQGGEIVLASGTNHVGLLAGSNTVYGGSGTDDVSVVANAQGTVQGGLSTIYAGDGSTAVNVESGLISVVGSMSVTATLSIVGSEVGSYVNGGFGTLVDFSAAGTVFGGASGGNVIVGSTTDAATITGGGPNDYIEGNSAGTVITAADDGTTVNIHSSDETVNGGYGTTTINIGAGTGTVAVNAGSGAFAVNVATGSVSFTGGAGGGTFLGGAGPDTVSGGQGTIYATASAGYLQGGTDGNNTIIGGSGNSTLVGAGNNDYLQAGSGNTSLIGSVGSNVYSNLTAGNGSDTLVGNASPDGATTFNFTQVTGTSLYEIDNFNAATVGGANYDNIYLANQADVNQFVVNATQVGSDVVTTVNGAVFDLKNTTIAANGTVNNTNTTLADHVKG